MNAYLLEVGKSSSYVAFAPVPPPTENGEPRESVLSVETQPGLYSVRFYLGRTWALAAEIEEWNSAHQILHRVPDPSAPKVFLVPSGIEISLEAGLGQWESEAANSNLFAYLSAADQLGTFLAAQKIQPRHAFSERGIELPRDIFLEIKKPGRYVLRFFTGKTCAE